MKLFKTNLVQAQEDIQEANEVLAILESHRKKIADSIAVPSWLLSDNNSFDMWSHCTEPEWYSLKYLHKKPNISAIEIDVTKFP